MKITINYMKKFLPAALLVLLVAVPAIASAQYVAQGTSIFDVLGVGVRFLRLIPIIIYTVATIILMVNIVRYLVAGGDGEAKQKALKGIGFSFLGLFLMLGINGVIFILASTSKVKLGGEAGGQNGMLVPTVSNALPI